MLRTSPEKISHGLKKKRWKKEHIAFVSKAIKKNRKHDQTLLVSAAVTLLGDLILLLGLVPAIIILPQAIYIAFVFVAGVCFGLLMDPILREHENLTRLNYIFFAIALSASASGLFFIFVEYSKIIFSGFSFRLNYLLIITVYKSGFFLPYIYNKSMERKIYGR